MSLPDPRPEDVVLVTGASSGIGEAVARELARRGYGLVIAGRDLARLRAVAAELDGTSGPRVAVVECDLRAADGRATLVARVRSEGRRLVGVVNAAGLASVGDVRSLPAERELEIVEVNVVALHALTVQLLPILLAGDRGAVLNIASTTAFQPLPGLATYAASKAFVHSFSEALHAELAGTGVSCTTLSPGPVRTPIWANARVPGFAGAGPALLWSDAEPVARAAVDGMRGGARSVVPGAANRAWVVAGRIAPRSVLLPAVRRIGIRRVIDRLRHA